MVDILFWGLVVDLALFIAAVLVLALTLNDTLDYRIGLSVFACLLTVALGMMAALFTVAESHNIMSFVYKTFEGVN